MAPRDFGGSATLFLFRSLWRLHCRGDGCDRREHQGALAGQDNAHSFPFLKTEIKTLNLQMPDAVYSLSGRHISESVSRCP